MMDTWRPYPDRVKIDLMHLIEYWSVQDWCRYGAILKRVTPLLECDTKEESDFYFNVIVPPFLDRESDIYLPGTMGEPARDHPFEFITDALESEKCPPAILAMACHSQQNLYRLIASTNPNCPDDDAVLVALARKQNRWNTL